MTGRERISKGCARCRQRRVKCDEGRPSCNRCIVRNEVCEGYRDEGALRFRSENEKVARKVAGRPASTQNKAGPTPPHSSGNPSVPQSVAANRAPPRSSGNPSVPQSVAANRAPWKELRPKGTITPPNFNSGHAPSVSISSASSSEGGVPIVEDPGDLPAGLTYRLDHSNPYPSAKEVSVSKPTVEDEAVDQFFEKYVMYPCNSGSSPGFLEHLPSLFKECKYREARVALRWAVRAASYASLSNEQNDPALGNKALECYGLALSALGESLLNPSPVPSDYDLMTIVVLDILEAVRMGDQDSQGLHAQGMASILRLHGKYEKFGTRSWSLLRLSYHRLQRHQLAFKHKPLPDSKTWLESLNGALPEVKIEKENHQISKICERARELLSKINENNVPLEETVEMMKEINALDQAATTWRHGPAWTYKTFHRSQLTQDRELLSRWPEWIQLHRDVWIAYEWNYHRTSRIVMHEHLLERLDRLHNMCVGYQANLRPVLCSFEEASINIIKRLADEVLSTVPQSLGEVDFEGNVLDVTPGTKLSRAIGGYFLLWPMKIVKSTRSATSEQRGAGQDVFERIRECTGMKTALGDDSKI